MYDGRVNKYNTWKDCVTYALLPFIETPSEMTCTIRVCIVSGKKFEKDMKKNPICFVVFQRTKLQ